ncbi:hypothetical protein C5B42_05305 [Candidatus Cerribacteria bacterium 'Amazon FNV 2010 28 9']|uniref:Uncharacterized protein n=1 Tax=Candidatus Cerribacteria bacterium 'Amazon FNV 2010 28 9' TaxID=2081795 RepID=A0A317JRI0_9BACT|nr:MAG: hypothetical protein C5B42_05305 [Candidatus Cerribacteria bacterium 'Amazon FNV 2010 28 9']
MYKKQETLQSNTQELKKVEHQLKLQNSFVQSFLRGLFTALGTTIGLTIVVGILAFVVNALAKRFGLSQVVATFFQQLSK